MAVGVLYALAFVNRFVGYLAFVALAASLTAENPWARLVTSVRNESHSFLILLQTSPGAAAAALQCDLVVPPAIEVNLAGLQPSSAATLAGKTLNCAAVKTSGVAIRYTCILAGGESSIPDGPVISVNYAYRNAREQKTLPPIRVSIERALVVASDSTPIPVPNTEAILAAR
jgi:hypothetical protein